MVGDSQELFCACGASLGQNTGKGRQKSVCAACQYARRVRNRAYKGRAIPDGTELFCSCGTSLGLKRPGRGLQKATCNACKRCARKAWREEFKERERERSRNWWKEKRTWVPEILTCKGCNIVIGPKRAEGMGGQIALCDTCKAEDLRKRSSYRRALKRGVGSDKIDRLVVFERDGWKCMLCGGELAQLERWPHPEFPTIDHIVPLSRGGAHTYVNVQAAHLGCNLKRGVTELSQMITAESTVA
jgi:hypothetical protein